MTSALKMVKLDFMTVKSQGILLAMVGILVFFGFTGTSVTVMWLSSAWFSALMSTNIFAIQEKNNLNRLYGSMSIGLKDIVMGRYIFIFLIYAVALLASIVVYSCFSVALFHHDALQPSELMTGFGLSLVVFSVITGIQTPIFFKWGYTKSRVYSMIPLFVVMALIMIPSTIDALSGVLEFLNLHQSALTVGGIVVSVIIQFCSYRISIAFYRKQKRG